jgi:hypothetical protein
MQRGKGRQSGKEWRRITSENWRARKTTKILGKGSVTAKDAGKKENKGMD